MVNINFETRAEISPEKAKAIKAEFENGMYGPCYQVGRFIRIEKDGKPYSNNTLKFKSSKENPLATNYKEPLYEEV